LQTVYNIVALRLHGDLNSRKFYI
jgi:hypothetical protein